MARGKSFHFASFSGGLNLADDPTSFDEGEARFLLNVVDDERGCVRSRDGSLVVRDAAADFAPGTPMTAITTLNDSSGRSIIMYGYFNGGSAGERALRSDGQESDVATSTVATPWNWVRGPATSGQGPIFGMNGTDAPRYVTDLLVPGNWTASTGTVPNGKFMCQAGNRLWVSGVASDPYAVYWSEVGDFRNWPAANVTRFDPNDGLPVTGIARLGSYVMVFKESAIYRIYDLDSSANVRLDTQAGTLAARSIAVAGDECYFLDSENGVSKTNGDAVLRVSDKILPALRKIPVDKASLAAAEVWRDAYYLTTSIPGMGAPTDDVVLAYNLKTGGWWVHGNAVVDLAVRRWQGGNQLIGVTKTCCVVRLFVPGLTVDGYQDGTSGSRPDDGFISGGTVVRPGSSYASYWMSGIYDFNTPQVRSRVRELRVQGSGALTAVAIPDTTSERLAPEVVEDATAATLTFDASKITDEQSLYSPGVANNWSVQVRTPPSGTPWRLDGYTFSVAARRD